MLLVVICCKLIAEIALMAFVGQWVLWMLAGPERERNPFYRVLAVMTSPFIALMRWITPRAVPQRHLPPAAFLMLAVAWVALTATKIHLCLQAGGAGCR